MPFKTVLTIVSPHRGDDDLKMVSTLCSETDAHLSIVILTPAPAPPIGAYAIGWFEQLERDEHALKRRTAAVSRLLASSTVSSDLWTVYPEVPSLDDVVGRRARYADITVLGPELLSDETLKAKALEGTLFSSGKPVLLIPAGAKASLRPKRVNVAWDSRVEASNAVASSLDMLRMAEEVRLVLVDPVQGEGAQGAEPGADAATYLARHGVKVVVDRLPSQGQPIAEVLGRHAVDKAAEVLVMGAYGHSRLRERLFGGVTRSMIETPPLPVLMGR